MLKPILKPLILALSMLAIAPMAAQAAELTLLPSVKLQIGDRDNSGNYWDGGHWRDHSYWKKHYEWRENRWQPHHSDHRDFDRHDNGRHLGHDPDHHRH
ncbi:DUF2502 domain-containing protein [Pseudescherichia sp.]|uniref:DUF2502 domain-containing protein n=1 Tax=Pseudescherichia sp. TaxID=2055881 RepID=UPI002897C5DA|nr:DUF2502 domain-containing protein [Pseudescherichia sp.]